MTIIHATDTDTITITTATATATWRYETGLPSEAGIEVFTLAGETEEKRREDLAAQLAGEGREDLAAAVRAGGGSTISFRE